MTTVLALRVVLTKNAVTTMDASLTSMSGAISMDPRKDSVAVALLRSMHWNAVSMCTEIFSMA
jgi:hypothetical protein